tara:strand:- start:1968 stop:2309 length:342 start_codon:yes stop_codon:yes gene_type:complete
MRYFDISDFDCQETGNNEMCQKFLNKLDELRHNTGFPFVIKSGYRDPSHSIELRKLKPGTHSEGIAADVRIRNGAEGYRLAYEAFKAGFTGIGIAKTFIHVDTRIGPPVIWIY